MTAEVPVRRWLVLIAAALLGSAAAAIVAVAINVATGGESPWFPAVERHPLWWIAGGSLAGAAAAHLFWQAQRWAEGGADPADAADRFGTLVQHQLAGYLSTTRHPAPMPVSWRLVRERWADHWDNVVGTPGRPPAVDSGRAEELCDLFGTLEPGRLVIVGAPGSGKTVLAARLSEQLLPRARRDPLHPIPVVVAIASWDPETTAFADWLADRLARDYTVLDARDRRGRRLADVLVKDQRRVLPVLDGFDELAGHLRAAAIAGLNADVRLPLVVTGGLDEYREAAGDEPLKAAAVVRLAPLAPDDVAAYLGRSTQRHTADGKPFWDGVIRALRRRTPLREVLTSPLMTFLATASAAARPGPDPAELLRASASKEELEAHLVERFLPAVYRDPRRPSRWLTGLAQHLHATGTREIAWWRLEHLVPDRAQVLVVAGFVTVTSIAGSVVLGAVADHGFQGVLARTLTGLTIGPLAGALIGKLTLKFRPELLRYRLRLTGEQLRAGAVPLGVGLLAWALGTQLGLRNVTGVVAVLTLVSVAATVFVVPDPGKRAANPERLLARSRTTALINLTLAAIAGIIGSRLLGLTGVGTFALALPSVLLASVWGRWVLFVRIWLPLRGRLPWRLHRFLAEACELGVLRRSGAVHHFRHARLQDSLAGISPSPAFAKVTGLISRSLAGSGGTTTLARLARDLNCDVPTVRGLVESLVGIGAASASRGATPEPVSFTDLPEHARFALRLTPAH
ncbi:NACHT domain-containing protein [Amycolatopsis sp.]|uniref:NACHT domain-containing protein n=1 Tax=Amycolatopsis sp. TaxID=37632 RepID=UPI002D7EBA71|nr:NACHT domain-containing protein [Amycolatopsis sp.]HET6711257.1 NACHT domain-containing protein [Amycolatopsis sp.]